MQHGERQIDRAAERSADHRRSGTWTSLLPGALMTTSKVPLTGPVPVTVETLSVPVAMTVQLRMRGAEIRSFDGHNGVPSAASPCQVPPGQTQQDACHDPSFAEVLGIRQLSRPPAFGRSGPEALRASEAISPVSN